MVRLRYSINAAISSSSREERDLGNGMFEVMADSEGEGASRKVTLPGSSVDVPISLCGIASSTFVLIQVEPKDPNELPVEVQFRLDAPTADPIRVLPVGAGKKGYFLVTSPGITELYASNMGTIDVSLTLYLAGD